MNPRIAIADIDAVLARRTTLPTIVMWNRLEGRPRARDFDRALRAEIRDALWMLTRQWQTGEFRGDDAGSPVVAKLQARTSPLVAYQPDGGTPVPFDPDVPLETTVEQRPVPFETRQMRLSLDLRLLMGRQWLRMLAPVGDFRLAYASAYPIRRPDPAVRADAPLCAHAGTWQRFNAVAGRAMDGAALYFYLTDGTNRHAYDGVGLPASAHDDVDEVSARFVAWCERLFVQPGRASLQKGDAWIPAQLEYQFALRAATPDGRVLTAEEYHHGRLDWYNLDVEPTRASLGDGDSPAGDPEPPQQAPYVFIPTALRFDGMPNTRWWAFEEGRTNFGDITPDTQEIGKLIAMEFALVYANDWFLLPLTAPVGCTLAVQGLAVTNVFGERTWIQPAGGGPDEGWHTWRMFNLSVRGDGAAAPRTSLLMLPTIVKALDGPAVEEVALVRDEVANMVWGIELTVPLADGTSKPGREAAIELRSHVERIVHALAVGGTAALEPTAPIRYEIMNAVPEHWIPFVPVRKPGDNREIQLQRASMPRIIPGDNVDPPEKVKPRTVLLREGLDADPPTAYFLHEEEVPRTGVLVSQGFQRTRWYGGRVITWFGARKTVGRGESASGLAFDQVRPQSP